MTVLAENYDPNIQQNGFNTNKAVSFAGGVTAAGGFVELDTTTTTGTSHNFTASALTSGIALAITANSATTGSLLKLSTSAVYTGTGATGIMYLSATGITSGQAIYIDVPTLTTGTAFFISGSAAAMTTGSLLQLSGGANTTGRLIVATSTGAYTGTTGLWNLQASNLTTGSMLVLTGGAAAMTTGFYLVAADGALNVFTIGANGHLTSNQTTAPTIASLVAQGITAGAITAGSTDTCGQITTTGTQNNTADSTLTVTFNKTYTTAPKTVILTPSNAAAALAGSGAAYISSITATTFVIGIAKSATTAATPSWYYQVIA